ncbi:MAG: hypothetical protein IJ348_01780 [Alistipes sp.]|nr:hypothetical protein [Alistipes sp.]
MILSKHITNRILVMLVALLGVACSTDEGFVQEAGTPTAVELCVALDSESRAEFGRAEAIDCLYYEIYRVDADGTLAAAPAVAATATMSNGKASVSAMLVPELNYKAHFWAYNSAAAWGEDGSLDLSALTMPAAVAANSDLYDAFTGTADISVATFSQSVTLTRPLAELSIYLPQSLYEAIADPSTADVTVVVRGAALRYDALTTLPLAHPASEQTFTATGLDGEVLNEGGGYRRLAACYLLPVEDVEVTLTVKCGSQTIIDGYVIDDFPLEANRRTNLCGKFSANI